MRIFKLLLLLILFCFCYNFYAEFNYESKSIKNKTFEPDLIINFEKVAFVRQVGPRPSGEFVIWNTKFVAQSVWEETLNKVLKGNNAFEDVYIYPIIQARILETILFLRINSQYLIISIKFQPNTNFKFTKAPQLPLLKKHFNGDVSKVLIIPSGNVENNYLKEHEDLSLSFKFADELSSIIFTDEIFSESSVWSNYCGYFDDGKMGTGNFGLVVCRNTFNNLHIYAITVGNKVIWITNL